MTNSVIRTAFDNIVSHLSNLDEIRAIVNELESEALPIESIIISLQNKSENAEVTLRTDIRILINECRHLMSRKNSR